MRWDKFFSHCERVAGWLSGAAAAVVAVMLVVSAGVAPLAFVAGVAYTLFVGD